MTTALEGGEGSTSRSGGFLHLGNDPVPIVQEAGWAPGRSPGFDSRTVQPVASCYTDYATRPTYDLGSRAKYAIQSPV